MPYFEYYYELDAEDEYNNELNYNCLIVYVAILFVNNIIDDINFMDRLIDNI